MIQLAKAKGVHTVNVVRPRPEFHELVTHLQGLGADIVTTDDELKSVLGECTRIITLLTSMLDSRCKSYDPAICLHCTCLPASNAHPRCSVCHKRISWLCSHAVAETVYSSDLLPVALQHILT